MQTHERLTYTIDEVAAALGKLCTGPGKRRLGENGPRHRHQEISTTRELPQFDSESRALESSRGAGLGRISLTGRTSPLQA